MTAAVLRWLIVAASRVLLWLDEWLQLDAFDTAMMTVGDAVDDLLDEVEEWSEDE